MAEKDKKKENCKDKSNSNVDRICGYIHRNTSNKKYKWNKKKFAKNMLKLTMFILVIGTFTINILYILGVDIIK